MFDALLLISLVGSCVQAIKEYFEPVIPAENWANKKLYNEDIANGVSIEQRMNNVENGKYKLDKTYPEPHKDKNGKIIIENCLLFEQDKRKYGVVKAYEWVNQGKYNLNEKELEKERERIKRKYERLYSY